MAGNMFARCVNEKSTLLQLLHWDFVGTKLWIWIEAPFDRKALGLDFGLNSSYKSKKTLHIDKLLLSIYYEKYVSLNTTIFQNSFEFVQYLLLLKFVLYKNSEEFSSKKEIGLIEKKVFLLKKNFLTIINISSWPRWSRCGRQGMSPAPPPPPACSNKGGEVPSIFHHSIHSYKHPPCPPSFM